MRVKHSIIPFILAAAAAVVFKLMSVIGLDGNGLFLGMSKVDINYTVIGITIGLFVVCVLINLFDRKTAPVYPVKKNFASGVLSVISGAAVFASSLITLLNTSRDSNEYYIVAVISAVFAVPVAIALVIMSKVHFVGKSTVSGISTLFIFPALWGCTELISEFLAASKVSISASDMTPLFCYIFITLYFFSHAMIVSRIKGRNPVKACFIYGLPMTVISLSYGLYSILTGLQEGAALSQQLIKGAEFISLALYAMSFIVEMTFNSYTKDQLEIIDGLPKDDDEYDNSYIKTASYDELVFADRTSKKDSSGSDEQKRNSVYDDLDDFVIGYSVEDEDEPIPYFTKAEIQKSKDEDLIVSGNSEKDAKQVVTEAVTPEKTTSTADVKDESSDETSVKPEEPIDDNDSVSEEEREDQRLSEIDKLLRELDEKL